MRELFYILQKYLVIVCVLQMPMPMPFLMPKKFAKIIK